MIRSAYVLLQGVIVAHCLVAGCTITADEIYPVLDEVPPEVVRTFPQQGWTQVPRSIVLGVWFSEPVEPSTVGVSTMTLSSGAYLQRCRYKVFQTDGGLGLVEMTPMEQLIEGVEYRLEIFQGVSDIEGNGIVEPFEVSFKTTGR